VKARPNRGEHALHWQQTHHNSCQPACLAIALRRRGQDPATVERQLYDAPGPHGHIIYDPRFVALPGVRALNFEPERPGLDQLRNARAGSASIVVNVFGPSWVSHLPPGTISPHGPLCPPGRPGRPYHAVVIVDWEEDVFFLLAPYYSAPNQPFEASEDELLDSLMGYALVVPF
jgi:hypothetical protein